MPHFHERSPEPTVDEQIRYHLDRLLLDTDWAMAPENLPRGEAPLTLQDAAGRRVAELKSVAYETVKRLVIVRLFEEFSANDETYNYIYMPGDSAPGDVHYFASRQLTGVDPRERFNERLASLEHYAPWLQDDV
jgi:hypothetical protein